MDALTRPMDTAELFRHICDVLKEKDMIPSILDYALPCNSHISLTTPEISFRNNLDYGASEGIYLDLWIAIYKDGKDVQEKLGTFKTLLADGVAMQIMGKLLADFIVEGYQYIRMNSDNFNWEGWEVYAFDSNGNRTSWSSSHGSKDDAIARKDKILDQYPKVVIRDNVTHMEEYYEKEKTGYENHEI